MTPKAGASPSPPQRKQPCRAAASKPDDNGRRLSSSTPRATEPNSRAAAGDPAETMDSPLDSSRFLRFSRSIKDTVTTPRTSVEQRRRRTLQFFDPSSSNKQGLFVDDNSIASDKKAFGKAVEPLSRKSHRRRSEDKTSTTTLEKKTKKRLHKNDRLEDDDYYDFEPVQKKRAKRRVHRSELASQALAEAAAFSSKRTHAEEKLGASRDKKCRARLSNTMDDTSSSDDEPVKKRRARRHRRLMRLSADLSSVLGTAATFGEAKESARKKIAAHRFRRIPMSLPSSGDDNDDADNKTLQSSSKSFRVSKYTPGTAASFGATNARARKETAPPRLMRSIEMPSSDDLNLADGIKSPALFGRRSTRSSSLEQPSADAQNIRQGLDLSDTNSELDVSPMTSRALRRSLRTASSSLGTNSSSSPAGSSSKKSKQRRAVSSPSNSKKKAPKEAASRKKEPEIIVIDDDDDVPKKPAAKPAPLPAALDESADSMDDVVEGETLSCEQFIQRKFEQAKKKGLVIALD